MIDGSQFLAEMRQIHPHLGLLLEQIINGVNGVSQHLGVDPTGKVDPPAPLGINVQAGDGMAHVQLSDNSTVRKNVQYFVEYSQDPAFGTSYVEHLGAARNRVIPLPALAGDGVTTHKFYFKAYSQYMGSDAQSDHAVFGGKYNPTAVTVGGTTKLDLLPAAGSGTAKPDGSQSGQGLGTVIERPAAGPKRSPAPITV